MINYVSVDVFTSYSETTLYVTRAGVQLHIFCRHVGILQKHFRGQKFFINFAPAKTRRGDFYEEIHMTPHAQPIKKKQRQDSGNIRTHLYSANDALIREHAALSKRSKTIETNIVKTIKITQFVS